MKDQVLDQDIVDGTVIEYDLKTAKYQYYANQIYDYVLKELSGKVGLIRSSMLAKIVEFSARSVIRVDPSIKPYEVKVSRDILKKLWSPYFLYYLTSIREFDYDYCYDEIIANNSFNSKKLNILFDEFLSWFYNKFKKEKELLKLAFVNRQPTLWRHGIPVLRLIPEDNNYKTIGVSPLTVEPYNADFDGDNMAIYIIHSIDALKEMEKKAYLKNTVRKDSDMSFLSRIRHEALYASFILTENKIIENNNNIIKINKLSELPNIDNIEWWNNKLNFPVNINGKIYSFGKCLFNLWCGFKNDIKIDFEITKSETNKLDEIIYNDCNKNSELFYERLTILIQMLLYFVSVTKHCPSINVNEMINILTENEEKIFNNLPENNPFIGYIINDSIIERCIKNLEFYKIISLYFFSDFLNHQYII